MPLLKEHYGSPRWTNEIADCSMPMTFDTYSNCSFNCLYCFSQFQRAIGGEDKRERYLDKLVAAVDVNAIKRMFTEPDKYAGQFATYIKQRRVMQWGGAVRRVRRLRAAIREDAGTAQILQEHRLPAMLQHEGDVVDEG